MSIYRNLKSAVCLLSSVFSCYSCEVTEELVMTKSHHLELPAFDPDKIPLTNRSTIQNLYQILSDIHNLFNKYYILYWADGGTLLGCVRHQGIIPWDDDLDIAINQADSLKVLALKPELQKLGYEVISGLWLRIQLASGPIFPFSYDHEGWDNKTRIPWIDIFPFELRDNKYIHASKHALKLWANDQFSFEAIRNKKLSPFGGFNIWIPDKSEEILKNFYGDDVLTYGVYEGDHMNYGQVKYKWKLSKTDRLPAKLESALTDKNIS